jgi:hypothetical protein
MDSARTTAEVETQAGLIARAEEKLSSSMKLYRGSTRASTNDAPGATN